MDVACEEHGAHAHADTEFQGTQLKQSEKMLLLFESANFDEKVFGDPENFRIDRYPNNQLAFGSGTHFCLGNQLARLELSVMQTRLLQRLPDVELVSEAPRSVQSRVRGVICSAAERVRRREPQGHLLQPTDKVGRPQRQRYNVSLTTSISRTGRSSRPNRAARPDRRAGQILARRLVLDNDRPPARLFTCVGMQV